MNFQEILKNKPLLYTIIGVIVVVFAVFISVGMVAATKAVRIRTQQNQRKL
jgi:nitrogen fixation protein FixH